MSNADRRYAEALLGAMKDAPDATPETAGEELGRLVQAIEASSDLRNILENPSHGLEDRLKVLNAVMDRLGLNPRLRSFVRLVLERDRGSELEGMAKSYAELLAASSGRATALVTSAQPIDDATLGRLVAALEKRTGKAIDAKVEIDPTLIGGIRAQVGNIIFDGSVRAELDKLREQLSVV